MAGGSAGSIFVDLILNDSQYREGFKNSSAATKKATKEWKDGFDGVKESFKGLAEAVGITLSIGGLIELTKSSLEAADAIAKTADRVGLTTDEIQKYQYAAKITGLTNEDLEKGFTKLNAGIADGKLPYKNASDGFKTIANQVQSAGNAVNRASIVNDVFTSKLGAKFIPMLSQGSAGLKKLGDQAQALGLVLDGGTIRGAEDFKDTLEVLGEVLSKNFQHGFLGEFVDESGKLRDIYSDPQFVAGIQSVGKALGDLVKFILENLPEATTVMATFAGAATGAVTGGAIGSVVPGLGTGLGAAAGAITGGFTAFGVAGNKTGAFNKALTSGSNPNDPMNLNQFLGEDKGLKDNSDALLDNASAHKKNLDVLHAYVTAQDAMLNGLAQQNGYIGESSIEIEKQKAALADSTEASKKLLDVSPEFRETFQANADSIASAHQYLLQYNYEVSRLASTGASNFFAKYAEDATDSAKQIQQVLTDAFQGAEDALFNFVKTGKLNFSDLVNSILDDLIKLQIKRTLGGLADGLNDLIKPSTKDGVTTQSSGGGLLNSIFGSLLGGGKSDTAVSGASTLSSLFSGFFADGGYIPPGQWGVAGEAGAEAIYGGKSGMTVVPQVKGGGTTFNIDATGADMGAVARIQQMVIALAGPGVTEDRIKNARKRGNA